MKRTLYLLLIFCLLFVNLAGCISKTEYGEKPVEKETISIQNTYKAPEKSQEELYQDIFVTLLSPYIQKAIDDYYSKYLTTTPNYALESIEVININRPMGYRSFLFTLKLQVKTYIGPHIDIGVDQLTFSVGSGEVKIEKFEHIKSYYDNLPPNYKDIIRRVN